MHLFISHATGDGAEAANSLVAVLESLGRRCWIAPRDVRVGIPYPGQIVSAIENCAIFVLLLTSGANESPDVLQELQLAAKMKKTIAPVIIGRLKPVPDIDYYISVRQQIVWSEVQLVAAALLAGLNLDDQAASPVAEPESLARARQTIADLLMTERVCTFEERYQRDKATYLQVIDSDGADSEQARKAQWKYEKSSHALFGALILANKAMSAGVNRIELWSTWKKIYRDRDNAEIAKRAQEARERLRDS